jgi:RNA polymerase sigma-70 factor (ECF subfamily)
MEDGGPLAEELVEFLRMAGPELHGLLVRLTLRADLAEDLMQELFLKLRRSAGFRAAVDARAYAFRVAIHLALDARRREKGWAELPESLAAEEGRPLEGLVRQEQAQRVLGAVAELSALAREAAVLHFVEQRSYAEAAAVMGKTEHQVRGLCQDALRQLRAALGVRCVEAAKEVSHEG